MDFTTITLSYGASFGKGDGSDLLEWEVDLNEDQIAAYRKAVMTRTPLDEVPELEDVLSDAYDEIKEQETDKMLDCDDEYTMECMGENEMGPNELNALVHQGDSHAIEFFGLQKLAENDLQCWDANDLKSLPLVKDFDDDFESESPFDAGWTLIVYFPDMDEIDLENEEIESYLKELFSSGELDLVEVVVNKQKDSYSGDIKEKALELAAEQCCFKYVEKHKEELGK